MHMHEPQAPFAADPYRHQPDSQWKRERLAQDQDLMCRLLGMEADQTYQASAQYVGREEDLFRFVVALRFFDHVTRNELTEGATMLRMTTVIFAVEGIAPRQVPTQGRLARFMVIYVTREEKIQLLLGLAFTEEYALGQGMLNVRHLMYPEVIADAAFREEYFPNQEPECGVGEYPLCFCRVWLQNQNDATINRLADQLARRLYRMRCAVVHDATPVFFATPAAQRPANAAIWSATLVAVYTDRERRFIMYESGLIVEDILQIFKNGFRRCFGNGCRFQV